MDQEDYKKIEEIYKKRTVLQKVKDAAKLKAVKDFDDASLYITADYETRISELHNQLKSFNQDVMDYIDSIKIEMNKEYSNISKFESILEEYAMQLISESYLNGNGTKD